MRWLLGLWLPLVCAPLLGRGTTGTLIGTVMTDGKPVSGVTIVVSSPDLQGIRTTLSGPGGGYSIPALPPGLYAVIFERQGYQTLSKRARVELAQTARADAELKPSEISETVTVTAIEPTLLERPEMATTFDAVTIDRLPVDRSVRETLLLAPGLKDDTIRIDGVRTMDPFLGESMRETTILRGATPPEYASADLVLALTKSGGNDFSGLLRDTIMSGEHLFEANLGGRMVQDRIWFFVATAEEEQSGKLTVQPFAQHSLVGSYRDVASLDYAGQLNPNLIAQALLSDDSNVVKASWFQSTERFGDHALVAGYDDELFLNDQWHLSPRWSFHLGLRRDQPRLAAIYGEGRHRLAAAYSRYAGEDETMLSYGTILGRGGFVRVDAFERDGQKGAHLQAGYRLFDIVNVGGNYTWSEESEDRANVWLTIVPPAILFGDVSLAILERYPDATDAALRYTVGVSRARLTLMLDALDLFDDDAYRFSIRLWF